MSYNTYHAYCTLPRHRLPWHSSPHMSPWMWCIVHYGMQPLNPLHIIHQTPILRLPLLPLAQLHRISREVRNVKVHETQVTPSRGILCRTGSMASCLTLYPAERLIQETLRCSSLNSAPALSLLLTITHTPTNALALIHRESFGLLPGGFHEATLSALKKVNSHTERPEGGG